MGKVQQEKENKEGKIQVVRCSKFSIRVKICNKEEMFACLGNVEDLRG